MTKLITILLVALMIAGFLIVMDGVGSNPLAMSCGSCDVQESVHSAGQAVNSMERAALLNPTAHVWSVEHSDGSTVQTAESCTMVTVVINEYHSYEVCE